MSPPCVSFFNGDNGGATHVGVTSDEARVVMYSEGDWGYCYYNGPCETVPANKTYDLAEPPEEGEPRIVRFARVWQRYFNERYQTYGRFVHMYFRSGSDRSAEGRRATAGEILQSIGPFASVEKDIYGNSGAFVDAMARRSVMNFGGNELRTLETYRKHPGLVWSFAPSAERVAEAFASFVCTKAGPYPASFSGNPGQNGTPRVFGWLKTTNPDVKQYQVIAALVRKKTEACGVRYVAEGSYPACPGLSIAANEDAAAAAIALFRANNVSTVVWPGCWEGQMTRAANAAGYYPEWLVADYRGFERAEVGALGQDQNAWARAWVVTPQLLMNADSVPVDPSCLDAYRSVDPSIDPDSFEPNQACEMYADLRQLFTGIQVAGPKLSPASVEKGFRAIPPKSSTNRFQPSCYYEPGDYTCVKDAIAQWWDPTAAGANAGSSPTMKGLQGCYRVGNDGQRFLPGDWPAGDILTMKAPGQICNLSNQY